MSVARFRVDFARPFDRATGAKVWIDRERLLLSVRLLRRRRVFTVPLAFVAENLIWQILAREGDEKIRAKREAKRAARLARRRNRR